MVLNKKYIMELTTTTNCTTFSVYSNYKPDFLFYPTASLASLFWSPLLIQHCVPVVDILPLLPDLSLPLVLLVAHPVQHIGSSAAQGVHLVRVTG